MSNTSVLQHYRLELVPISFKEASLFISQYHRHLKPPVGCKFCIATQLHNRIVAVIIVGRPVARLFDDGFTLEVNRLATDGTYNACSMLYAAAWRVTKNLGYRRLITYILSSESGTSLKASGWKFIAERKPRSWNCKSRPRVSGFIDQSKLLFEKSVII